MICSREGPSRPVSTSNSVFVFKEVVREEQGEMWPFRIFEGANVNVPEPPRQVISWQNIPVKVFLGFAFSGESIGKENVTELQVFAPNGEELGKTTFEIEAIPDHLTTYRSVDFILLAATPGVIQFRLYANGEPIGDREFTITHTFVNLKNPCFLFRHGHSNFGERRINRPICIEARW